MGTWTVGEWTWRIAHQYTITKSGFERDKDKILDTVDAYVHAERRFLAPPPYAYPFTGKPMVQQESLIFLGDAALTSVTKLIRRIELTRSRVFGGSFVILTRRRGLALAPIYAAGGIVIHPVEDMVISEQLPTNWIIERRDAESPCTLTTEGFLFDYQAPFPSLNEAGFCAVIDAIPEEPPLLFEWGKL